VAMIGLLIYGGTNDDPAPPSSSSPVQATASPTATDTAPPILTLGPATVIVRLADNKITAAKRSIKPVDGKITLALVNTAASPLRFVLARGKPHGAAAIATARVLEVPLQGAEVQTEQVDVGDGDYTLIVRKSDDAPAVGTTSLRVR
jgi:hypothetical protein